jgi:hypothetical protein
MIHIYNAKFVELCGLDHVNTTTRIRIDDTEIEMNYVRYRCGWSPQIMDLDRRFRLDLYDRLFALSKECLDRELEFNARERIIFAKLRELSALEEEIMGDHGSELGMIEAVVRSRFRMSKSSISIIRRQRLELHRQTISKGLSRK